VPPPPLLLLPLLLGLLTLQMVTDVPVATLTATETDTAYHPSIVGRCSHREDDVVLCTERNDAKRSAEDRQK
jgi:hypothetical protein